MVRFRSRRPQTPSRWLPSKSSEERLCRQYLVNAFSFCWAVAERQEAWRRSVERSGPNRPAADSITAIRLFDQADVQNVADGTYSASSLAYNGVLHVEVMVAQGRIEDVRVTDHNEKQFYSALTDTTKQIIQKQSVKNIDATSRATITSQAIVNATAKALSGGQRRQ